MASALEILATLHRKTKERPKSALLAFGTHAPLAALLVLFLLFFENGAQRDFFWILLFGTPIFLFIFVWAAAHGLLAVVDFAENPFRPRELVRKAIRVLLACAGWTLPFSLILCGPLFDASFHGGTIWPKVLLMAMANMALWMLYFAPFAIYRDNVGSWRREAACFAFSACAAAPSLLYLLLA